MNPTTTVNSTFHLGAAHSYFLLSVNQTCHVFQDRIDQIAPREKSLAEVVGERIIAPLIGKTTTALSAIRLLAEKLLPPFPFLPGVNGEEIGFSPSVQSDMRHIRCWEDVRRLAGYVVAYQTDSHLLNLGHEYHLKDRSILFGYVEEHQMFWSEGERGYNMKQFIRINGAPGLSPLTDSTLGPATFMRLATPEELRLMREAIQNKKAVFEYVSDTESALALLIQHERRVSQHPLKKFLSTPRNEFEDVLYIPLPD